MSEAEALYDLHSGIEINDPNSIWYVPSGQSLISRKRKKRVPINRSGKKGRFLMRCHCGESYIAKGADLGRGWGFSCSKSCASRRRAMKLKRAVVIKEIDNELDRYGY